MNTLTLPLSYGETTRFIFKYNRQGQDVITIKHRNIPYFINLDCGTMMFYEVLEATSTNRMMDSLVTTNPNIDNNEKKTLSYILRLLMLSSVLLASPDAWGQIHKSGAQLPSTQDKEKKTPLYQGLSVGVEIAGLGSYLLGSDILSSEIAIQANLKTGSCRYWKWVMVKQMP